MIKLKQVVQTWEDGDTSYTVTTTYDDAGNGTAVDSRGDAAFAQPPIPVVTDKAHEKAVAAVQASVAVGDISPTQGAEAISRLNTEKANAPLNLPPLALGAALGGMQEALSHLRSQGVLDDRPIEPAVSIADLERAITPKVEAANAANFATNIPKAGPLPKDFPYLDALHKADPPINTYGQLAKFADDYTQIPHVGEVGAKAIAEAVK